MLVLLLRRGEEGDGEGGMEVQGGGKRREDGREDGGTERERERGASLSRCAFNSERNPFITTKNRGCFLVFTKRGGETQTRARIQGSGVGFK